MGTRLVSQLVGWLVLTIRLRWLHRVIIYGVARVSVMFGCCFCIRVFTQSS